MVKLTREFQNERGENVTITVTVTAGGMEVTLSRETEMGEIPMTPEERKVLAELTDPANFEGARLPAPQDPWK